MAMHKHTMAREDTDDARDEDVGERQREEKKIVIISFNIRYFAAKLIWSKIFLKLKSIVLYFASALWQFNYNLICFKFVMPMQRHI